MTTRLNRVAIAAAAVGLLAGTVVAISDATASASSRPHTAPIPLDHFLCYQSRAAGISPNANTLLSNALQPTPFAPVWLKSGYWHCNPSNKLVGTTLFKSKNPLGHLFCFGIAYSFKGTTINLENQFGTAVMKVGAPTQLCLPSWKTTIAPPNAPTPYPPGLDHFTCYPLTAAASSYDFHIPASVKAEDEFSFPKFVALKLGRADRLCVPTTKIVDGTPYPPATSSDLSLVCFPTSPTPLWKTVYDENQFGTALVAPTTVDEQFCLPSEANLVAAG